MTNAPNTPFGDIKADTVIKLPNRPGKAMPAGEYLYARQIPNFFFHTTTAYDLLRHGGVEVGKADYLGKLDVREV